MNKKGGFYIDVDIASKQGVLERASVYLNGKKVEKCIAAKSGSNGFVEYFDNPDSKKSRQFARMYDELPTRKKRGKVQIKIKPI